MRIENVVDNQQLNDAFSVRNKVFVEEQKVPLHLEQDEYENEALHFVGYVQDQPVAAGRMRINKDYAKLERICVLKSHRGHSLGKQLILAMEQNLIKQGVKKAKLGAQTHAESFYHKLGYSVISNVFYDANMPHVMMEKDLIQ
ncbi:GNAT family N-acetyltransferase [Paraliobacillus ryukyuensis]|uniref:GNAT family N-acetyltransferase n=1 Tax=Paraliobacillus ryukyuensis TaxID=200904 RepID=UPI0009A6C5B2|nr:GNAT family N-acetyltransferase [Paraliobacillus ryukyuensis]